MISNSTHRQYMQIAIDQAKIAFYKGEVPVGSVIAGQNGIITQSHNLVEETNNPLMHAEIIAINNACNILKTKYLSDYDIYVTLEPCVLCMQAIKMARIKRVFFAAEDDNLTKNRYLKESEIYQGILQYESKALLKKFFQTLRAS